METKVTLVEWPRHPIETVYYLWEAARSNEPMEFTPDQLAEKCKSLPILRKTVRETFEKVVDSAIPIAENLNFVFLLEGVSISFREQMVRHKVGMKYGERLGVDMFPDLHDSTWWAQSTRAMDMSKFFEDKLYRIPDTVKKNPEALHDYESFMASCAHYYQRLIAHGVPGEDAREVLPLGTQHRISWGMNLSSMMHVTKKRSCWIMQLGVWEPIIKGIISELVTKVDPYFATLVTPPCMKKDTFNDCLYHLDNERRIDRKDPLLPCPLFIAKHTDKNEKDFLNPQELKQFYDGESDYRHFWMRDTRTGERLVK